MNNLAKHGFWACFCVLCAACQTGASRSSTPRAEVEAILQVVEDLDRAENAGDLEQLLSLLTDDVVWMPPGEPALVGKDALRDWYNVDDFSLEISHKTKEARVDGDLAYNWGIATGAVTRKADGKRVPLSNKYIQVLRKQPDGAWKISHVIWNGNRPAADQD